jgi:amidase
VIFASIVQHPTEGSAADRTDRTELTELDGLGLAELVKKGELSPLELVEHTIARIEALDGRLGAVSLKTYDEARRVARGEAPGLPAVEDGAPFRGVPMLVKDILAGVAGLPTTSGSRFLRDFVAPRDSELVRRMRKAGFVLVGKTTTPELGLVPVTESALFGATRNPWDTTRTPGGSSGGAAAAVAARYLPLAHGSDGGGSIRIPAACCGLFGLKPTRGRTTLGPELGDIMNGLVVEHALTRTVRDSAAFLDAVHGPLAGDPYFAPPPAEPFLSALERPPKPLRVALHTRSPMGTPVHPAHVEATQRAGRLLESLGHVVEEAWPAIDEGRVQTAFSAIWLGGAAATVTGLSLMLGRQPKEGELEPLTAGLAMAGRGVSAADYLVSIAYLQGVARQLALFHETYDVLLTPTLAEPPLPIGALDPEQAGGPMGALLRAGAFTPFTPLVNATGAPAMSVPLYEHEGLPLGIQVIGRFGDEATLLALARQLEVAAPWASRRPAGL